MARPKVPTIPDDKIYYFREQLYRELAHMFEWTGLPTTVPADYIEDNLMRHGYVLYYEDENIGQDILRAEVVGYNRHGLPVQARTFTPNTIGEKTTITRNLRRLSDGENVKEIFNPSTDGVLIMNMWDSRVSKGQHMGMIVNHFAQRLALAQQAFDTNLMWANVPYIFQTSTDETRLSIEKMFSEIFTGQPFIITDKSLFTDNKDRAGLPTDIPFIGQELMDVQNEIMMKFRETVGFDTAGVDKAERVNTLEVQSNNQHTSTVLRVMLQQRQIACESINAFFGTNISVDLYADENVQSQQTIPDGGGDNGGSNGAAGTTPGQD
jgi:hypothetical protein